MPPRAEILRDWIAEAHVIARAAPGLGNPLDLTVREFDEHLGLSIRGGSLGGSQELF